MTLKELIAEGRSRLEKCSDFNWRWKDDEFQGGGLVYPIYFDSRPIATVSAGWQRVQYGSDGLCDEIPAEHGEFIVWARNNLAQLLDAVERMQCQPISTAPKDGTWVLGYTPRSYMITMFGNKINEWVDTTFKPVYPDLWMPLPELPTLNPKEGK